MLLYASEHQTDVFKQNPQLSKKDVREILNKLFLSLNAEQRAVYQEKYLKSMKDYWIELENFWYELLILFFHLNFLFMIYAFLVKIILDVTTVLCEPNLYN